MAAREQKRVEHLAQFLRARSRVAQHGPGLGRQVERAGRDPLALQRFSPKRLGPTPGRHAQFARQEPDDAVGQVEAGRVPLEVRHVGVGPAQIKGQVAHHLGAGGNFHDIAEDPIGFGVQESSTIS